MDTHFQDTTIVGPVKPIVKRRKYSKALKRQIVEECLAGNDSASVVARRHDINANLLFKWRRLYETGALGNEPGATTLVPIVVKPTAQMRSPAPVVPESGARSNTGNMDICLATGHRLSVAGGVCPVALRTALEVLSA